MARGEETWPEGRGVARGKGCGQREGCVARGRGMARGGAACDDGVQRGVVSWRVRGGGGRGHGKSVVFVCLSPNMCSLHAILLYLALSL